MEKRRFYRQVPLEVHFGINEAHQYVLKSIECEGKTFEVDAVLSDHCRYFYGEGKKQILREMRVLIQRRERTIYNCMEEFFWYSLKEIDSMEYYRTMSERNIPKVVEVWKIYPEKPAAGSER